MFLVPDNTTCVIQTRIELRQRVSTNSTIIQANEKLPGTTISVAVTQENPSTIRSYHVDPTNLSVSARVLVLPAVDLPIEPGTSTAAMWFGV